MEPDSLTFLTLITKLQSCSAFSSHLPFCKIPLAGWGGEGTLGKYTLYGKDLEGFEVLFYPRREKNEGVLVYNSLAPQGKPGALYKV